MLFPLREGEGYRYRPLKRGLAGWDILALQKCLIAAGQALSQFGADGQFGGETDKAVRNYQRSVGLTADGIAGVLTQRQVCWELAARRQSEGDLPAGLLQGQIEAESSYWVGNYTRPYDNGRRDLGVVMHNLAVSDANCRFAFDAPDRIRDLARKLRERKDAYYGQPGAPTHKRAWQLAAGSHNAPAWTDRLADGGLLGPEQTTHIEAYIARVTTYVTTYGS